MEGSGGGFEEFGGGFEGFGGGFGGGFDENSHRFDKKTEEKGPNALKIDSKGI